MSLIQYTNRPRNPWTEFDALTNRVNHFFGDSVVSDPRPSGWVPPVNIEELEEVLTLSVELPGLTEEDIAIDIENNVLTVSGEKAATAEGEGADNRVHLTERAFGSFKRSFKLPWAVDSENVLAEFDLGVLVISIPKAPEARSRKIEVKRNK